MCIYIYIICMSCVGAYIVCMHAHVYVCDGDCARVFKTAYGIYKHVKKKD